MRSQRVHHSLLPVFSHITTRLSSLACVQLLRGPLKWFMVEFVAPFLFNFCLRHLPQEKLISDSLPQIKHRCVLQLRK